MNTTDINTTDTKSTRIVRRLAAIAIVGGLALSFAAAFAALRAESDVPGGGVLAQISDYLADLSDALVGGG
jgi:hypothetical protein